MDLPILDLNLDLNAQRVLGALLEKQMSTPDYYPLTLNALQNACNQSSNRDPVMNMQEEDILEALEALRGEQLIFEVRGARNLKYEHRLRERFELSEQEAAILCELLLRGPQTPGELRSRTARLYAFQDLSEVEAALSCLSELEAPLVIKLERQPGARESRYAHCLGTLVEKSPSIKPFEASPASGLRQEVEALKAEVESLKTELAELGAEFKAFKKQFD